MKFLNEFVADKSLSQADGEFISKLIEEGKKTIFITYAPDREADVNRMFTQVVNQVTAEECPAVVIDWKHVLKLNDVPGLFQSSSDFGSTEKDRITWFKNAIRTWGNYANIWITTDFCGAEVGDVFQMICLERGFMAAIPGAKADNVGQIVLDCLTKTAPLTERLFQSQYLKDCAAIMDFVGGTNSIRAIKITGVDATTRTLKTSPA